MFPFFRPSNSFTPNFPFTSNIVPFNYPLTFSTMNSFQNSSFRLQPLNPTLQDLPQLKVEEKSNPPPMEQNKKIVSWSDTEDRLLYRTICSKYPETLSSANSKKLKVKWSKIAIELNSLLQKQKKPKKMGKHCRERWINHLNPSMNKGQWSNDEDLDLMKAFVKFGKKWAGIAQELPKRSQHSIKNRFYHLMAKHLNVTNREVIKSKNSFITEALALLDSMRKNQNQRDLETEVQTHIKKEETTTENKPSETENFVPNRPPQWLAGNLNGLLNSYQSLNLNNGFFNNNFMALPSNRTPLPLNFYNLWNQNLANSFKK